jgi:hypothetical protein
MLIVILLVTMSFPILGFVPPAFAEVQTSVDVAPTLHPAYGSGMCYSGWHQPYAGGPFLTINTNSPAQSTNWAQWIPSLPTTGSYKVEALIKSHGTIYWNCPSLVRTLSWDTTDARYTIHAPGGDVAVARNQAPLFDQWLDLGTYNFNAGTSGWVKLTDLNGEPNLSRTISFSTMRFTLMSVPTSNISGQVVNADNNNNPLASVTISLSNGASTTTDINGNYTLSGIPAGTYTVTASINGMSFAPNNRVVTIPPDATGQNFTASPQDHFISGRVTDENNNAISGVSMAITGISWSNSSITDINGYYIFSGLQTGYYGVGAAPGLSYTLSPKQRTYSLLDYNAGHQDFSKTPQYGSLSGKVTTQVTGVAIPNAKVVAGGKQVSTNGNGIYTITNVLPGNVKISVSAANYASFSGQVNISSGQVISKNVTLPRLSSNGFYLPYSGGVARNVTCGHGCNQHVGKMFKYSYDFGYWDQIAKKRNLTIVAANDGVVKAIKKPLHKAWYVRILHPDKSYTVYAHIASLAPGIKIGAKVYRGQPIAVMGKTGATAVHLHFSRYSGWKSIETTFSDASTHAGTLVQGKTYLSQNYYVPALSAINATAPLSDTEPPYGSVELQFTGQADQYRLLFDADDYLSDVTEMRIAAIESELVNTPWQTYTQQINWGNPVAFVQFRDTAGNVSEAYSDWLDGVGYELPTASFSTSSKICVYQDLQISNDTTPNCPQCNAHWDFGNGQTSDQAEPQFDPYEVVGGYTGYDSPGEYTVTLTMSNYDSITSTQQTIEVLPSPSSDFTRLSIGKTIYVKAVDTTASEYLWDFGDGYTTTGQTASHVYADPDAINYSLVTLTETAQNTCSNFSSQYAQGPMVYLPIVIKR